MELTNHAAVIVREDKCAGDVGVAGGGRRIVAEFRFADGRTGQDFYATYAEIRRHMRLLGADSVEIIRADD